MDPRTEKLAQVLVHYSLRLKKGELLKIQGEYVTLPLMTAVFEEAVRIGAIPYVRVIIPQHDEIFLKKGTDAQFAYISPIARTEVNTMDVFLHIWGTANTRHLSGVDPKRQALQRKCQRPLSDKLFKGTASAGTLAAFLWFRTPQFLHWCIPIAVLLAGLVTVGILTRTSELVVMRACGISIYRAAAPLFLLAVAASGVLFAMQEYVLASTNRRADQLLHVIRGGSPRTFAILDRQWVVGRKGEIYNYLAFNPQQQELSAFSVFKFAPKAWRLQSRAFYRTVGFRGRATGFEEAVVWEGRDGWVREFDRQSEERAYRPAGHADLLIEPPQYFMTEDTDAERMTYAELTRYIVELRASGIDVTRYEVELHRKVSFPWVTIIMTLIAVPFGVTTGRRGAMYGIGLGLVLAVGYWFATSVFGAIGASGVMPPALGAWAPNLLFSAAAGYLLLTVRT